MPLGVDVGGTFTDFVLLANGRLTIYKLPTTTHDHAEAFLQGFIHLGGEKVAGTLIHGTTVVTNTLLERTGARTAFVTTAGFKDMLAIGRQTRPSLYELEPHRDPPLVPGDLCFEVAERIDPSGSVLEPLDQSTLPALIAALKANAVDSVAVCLLYSFLNAEHETVIRKRLESEGFIVSVSHVVLPVFREYERACATVLSAYVAPVLRRYLTRLEERLPLQGAPLRIMQSNGGIVSAAGAMAAPVQTVLSGPAAGVVGAAYVAGLAGYLDIITFDMGGTSTDVALVPGRLRETTESVIAGMPMHVPMLDVHTVGAGGGSLARVDAGGALRVGPQSAGADPGPACYGIGDLPTVTDAHIVLNRLSADHFLDGRMSLRPDRSLAALTELGRQMRLDAEAAAAGVVRIANVEMERALRVISVERGYDPRRFTLVAFGGAGPLHACDLAAELGIPRVLVPRTPGVLSALGLLVADVMKDFSQTVMWTLPRTVDDVVVRDIALSFRKLAARGWEEMNAEGLGRNEVQVLTALDMRYLGQSYELLVPFDDLSTGDLPGRFHAAHRERFGYHLPDEQIQVVNLRLKMLGKVERPVMPRDDPGLPEASSASIGVRDVWFNGWTPATVYDRDLLRAGHLIAGPALVVQMDATTAIPPGWSGRVDPFCNILLQQKNEPTSGG